MHVTVKKRLNIQTFFDCDSPTDESVIFIMTIQILTIASCTGPLKYGIIRRKTPFDGGFILSVFEWRVSDAYTEYGGLHRTNLYID